MKNKNFWFSSLNLKLFITAIIFLIIGFILMSFEELTVSVILLIVAYLVLIPLSIILKKNNKQ